MDHAPLVAFASWISRNLFGNSLFALRLLPALSAAPKVLLGSWMAREVGGTKFAQFLAALLVFLAPIYLTFDNFLSMNAFEPVFWMACAAIVLRILNGGSPIGHTVHLPRAVTPEPDMEIVGVVADAVYRRLRDPLPPTLYSPVAQTTAGPSTTAYSMSVRTASESPAQLSRSIADAIGGVNRDLTVTFRPLAEQVNRQAVKGVTSADVRAARRVLLAVIGNFSRKP